MQSAHQRRDLGLGVRIEHHEGILDAPVGGVGDVRDAGQAVEADVVAAGVAAQHLLDLLAQRLGVVEPALEARHRLLARRPAACANRVVAGTALLDLGQAMAQRADQRLAPLAVGEQVVFQIGIAPHDPDVAQHLVEHARRTAGDALAAQFVEHPPRIGSPSRRMTISRSENEV